MFFNLLFSTLHTWFVFLFTNTQIIVNHVQLTIFHVIEEKLWLQEFHLKKKTVFHQLIVP